MHLQLQQYYQGKKKDIHWDIHKSRQTDRDLTVFYLRFKISLWPLFFSLLEVLICPRLRSQTKRAVYFKDVERVNFKLFPRQAFQQGSCFSLHTQKELTSQFQKKKKFLSPRSISNHAFTIFQRLSQCLPSPESPVLPMWCFLPGSPRWWSVSSSTCWGRSWLGTSPRALPQPVAVSDEFVPSSNESGQLACQESQNTGPKQKPEYHQVAYFLVPLRSQRGWKSRWSLQICRNQKSSTTVGELENSGLLRRRAQRSEHSNLWVLNKGVTEFFIHRQAWLSRFAGAMAIAKSRTRVSEINSCS